MKIDSALSTFVERYDKAAMDSIDQMSHDFGRIYRKDTIPLFNINETFEKFNKWLQGYAAYCVDCKKEGTTPTQSVMTEALHRMLDGVDKFCEEKYTYDRFPSFVHTYIEGVRTLSATVNDVKSLLMESGIDQGLIGSVNEYTDEFMGIMEESFTPSMDKLLMASGYTTNKILFGKNRPAEPKPIFL